MCSPPAFLSLFLTLKANVKCLNHRYLGKQLMLYVLLESLKEKIEFLVVLQGQIIVVQKTFQLALECFLLDQIRILNLAFV